MFGRPMLRKPVAWKTDLIIIVVLAVVILPAAGRLDVFEYLIDELKIHDRWHGGDLLITAVFLAVAASIFSLRRSWELARIVNERESAPAETRVATGQPARPLPAASEAQSVRQPLNILLAEDNPVNQRVAVSMLEKRGHVVQSWSTLSKLTLLSNYAGDFNRNRRWNSGLHLARV